MKYSGHIEIPYELKEYNLQLEPGSKGKTSDDGMSWITDHLSWADEEMMERIFRATTLLFHANQGTWGECLDTAIIWEVG